VVGHKIYVSPARSINMPYSPKNIESRKQPSHEAHRGALG